MTGAKSRYEKLAAKREPFLKRARDAAALTIPYLFPPQGATGSTVFPTPYQGIGARGVNNLSSKLLLTLFPTNAPFFRLMITDKIQLDETALSKVEEVLSKLESEAMDEAERLSFRPSLNEALKHLVVAGNVLLFLQKDGLKVYHLDRYVVKRDPMGTPMEILLKETVSPAALAPEVITACGLGTSLEEAALDKEIDLFTYIQLDGDKYKIHQELNGVVVPKSNGDYPKDECPWLALRWAKIDGEDYGRGYIEEYLGDLISCEELSKAIVQGSVAASKVVFMVEPNGSTKIKALTKADNLDVIVGRATDVTVLQLEKYADFQVASGVLGKIEERLSYAFMLNSAVQRKGERVTAEEIRYMAGELEDSLGGIYSLLTMTLQLALVKALLAQMRKSKKFPNLPKESVKLAIVTGLEALGRNHDLEKLRVLLEYLAPLGPEVIQQYINVDDYITRVGTSLGINTKGLVRSAEEIAAAQQNDQMMQMAQQFAPEMLKQMSAQRGQQPPNQ